MPVGASDRTVCFVWGWGKTHHLLLRFLLTHQSLKHNYCSLESHRRHHVSMNCLGFIIHLSVCIQASPEVVPRVPSFLSNVRLTVNRSQTQSHIICLQLCNGFNVSWNKMKSAAAHFVACSGEKRDSSSPSGPPASEAWTCLTACDILTSDRLVNASP